MIDHAEPAVTYTAPAPVNENVAPVPAVSRATPAPVIEYAADHAVTCTAPAPVNKYVVPAPAIWQAAPGATTKSELGLTAGPRGPGTSRHDEDEKWVEEMVAQVSKLDQSRKRR